MSEPGTILIIDDEPINIQALNAILGEDYSTRFATSADQALTLLNQFPVDLILLDVVMPGMDGYALCQHIRELPGKGDTPIIFVTNRSSAEDEERGLRAGCACSCVGAAGFECLVGA